MNIANSSVCLLFSLICITDYVHTHSIVQLADPLGDGATQCVRPEAVQALRARDTSGMQEYTHPAAHSHNQRQDSCVHQQQLYCQILAAYYIGLHYGGRGGHLHATNKFMFTKSSSDCLKSVVSSQQGGKQPPPYWTRPISPILISIPCSQTILSAK